MSIERTAEANASIYVQNTGSVDAEEMARAKEDYTAGFVDGALHREEQLAFVRQQLGLMIKIAAQHDEFYVGSIASYVLEKIR